MLSIRSITFNHNGWTEVESNEQDIVWLDNPQDPSAVLSLHYYPVPPNIPFPLTELTALRNEYRAAVNSQGSGMVSFDVVLVDGLPSVRSIVKTPRKPHGMDYAGTLILPFSDCSYVIKIQAREVGYTGMRDAIIGNESNLSLEEFQTIWARDPYDPDGEYPWMPNQSEHEKYDEQFPEHPLSRVRATLSLAERTVSLNREVAALAPFAGP